MKTTLILSVLAAPLAFAAPFEPKHIPAEANWFLHGDLTALRDMEAGQFMMKFIRSEQAQALAEMENIFEFDPLSDLTDVILFGKGGEDEGALILSGKIGRDHLEEVIVHADDYRTTTYGATTIHHWNDDGNAQHAAFPGDQTVIITGQEELLKLSLDVFAGKKPGLTESPLPLPDKPGIVAFGNLGKIDMPDDEGSRIVRQARSMAFAISENGDRLQVNLLAETKSAKTAHRFAAVMEGAVALAELAEERVESLGIQCESTTKGSAMTMTMSIPVAKTLALLAELD